MNNHTPFITVVMPVRNEERFIRESLEQVLKQDYPKDKYEIIIADGRSSDKTREIVDELSRQYPQVKLMDNPGLLPSSGRNVGFKNGKGEYFVVVDGHCKIEHTNLLQNLADSFIKSGAECLGRPQPFIVPEEPTMQRAIALARQSKIGHSSNSYIHENEEAFISPVSMGCAYKKDVFEKIGYLDESFDACEDVEFNYRVEKAGFKTFFTPKIAIHYYPRENLKGLARQLIRYGVGRTKFMFKHTETLNFDMMKPIIFLLGVVTGPFWGLLHPSLFYVFFPFALLYILLISVVSIRIGKGQGLMFTLKTLIVFPTIHLSLGFGLLKGLFIKIMEKK